MFTFQITRWNENDLSPLKKVGVLAKNDAPKAVVQKLNLQNTYTRQIFGYF